MIASPLTPSVFRQVPGHDGLAGRQVLTWPAFGGFDVDVLVTTRSGGVSAGPYASLNLSLNVGDDPAHVLENRRRVLAALGAGLEDAVFAQQVHGAAAEVVGLADRGRGTREAADAIPGADALVTADPGPVLAVLAADCVPVVLYDPVAHVLACAHAGWRGTVAGAAASAVRAMVSLGSQPADLVVGLGPAIAPGRYQVGAEVAEAAAKAFGERASAVLHPAGPEQWRFDLWTANRMVLQAAGVPGGQIHGTDTATGPITPAPGPTSAGPASCASAGPASPAPSTPASPAPSTPASPAASTPTSAATATSAAPQPPDGWFFSHRAEQPCGRFGLLARLRPRESR
jgi:YfiH family protein